MVSDHSPQYMTCQRSRLRKPPPGAPGGPPPPEPPGPPEPPLPPDLPQAKPGWRTIHPRPRKKKKEAPPQPAAPQDPRHQIQSWATWQRKRLFDSSVREAYRFHDSRSPVCSQSSTDGVESRCARTVKSRSVWAEDAFRVDVRGPTIEGLDLFVRLSFSIYSLLMTTLYEFTANHEPLRYMLYLFTHLEFLHDLVFLKTNFNGITLLDVCYVDIMGWKAWVVASLKYGVREVVDKTIKIRGIRWDTYARCKSSILAAYISYFGNSTVLQPQRTGTRT